jgi:uracil-DNA glycosylase
VNSPIFLLGEAKGENEDLLGKGFVGSSGASLLRMLDDAKLLELTSEDRAFMKKWWDTRDPKMVDMIWNLHPEFFRSNVFQLRPPGNKIEAFCGGKGGAIVGYPALVKGKFVRGEFQPELDRLAEELINVNPNLILCLGNTACWAMLGQTTISKLRGTTILSTHTVDGFKCLPTFHPAAVGRQHELRPTVVADLMKAAREADHPDIRRPKREIWIEPDLGDIHAFFRAYIKKGRRVSVDIETAGNQITCIGFAPRATVAIVIPFVDRRKLGRNYWATKEHERAAWDAIRGVLEDREILKLFQNGLYDVAFIWRSMGIRVYGAEEDTMLLSHAMQPESLKGLGYLGSVFTDEGSWKQMRQVATIKRDD